MEIATPHKRVLAYGDSITWGRIACKPGRFDEDTRWTCLVQKKFGNAVEIIEEGLRCRMLEGENLYVNNCNGLKQFGAIFRSYLPLDLVLIFLGTNDMNNKANKDPEEIANNLIEYITIIESQSEKPAPRKSPDILILSPPHIDESSLKRESMFTGAGAKSHDLAQLYKAVAEKNGAYFFDAAQTVIACKEDGVHLDAEGNSSLANDLFPIIQDILFD